MKKQKRHSSKTGFARKHLLIAAALVVGLSSVAYAAYSKQVNINGTGTATGSWNVGITSITETTHDGDTQNSAPTQDGTDATFDVGLAFPGAYANYDVVVTDAGNIPAILSSFTDLTSKNASAPTYITYTVSGVTGDPTTGTTLGTTHSGGGKNDTNTIHVHVEWTAGTSPDTSSGNSKSATIHFNYDQNTT